MISALISSQFKDDASLFYLDIESNEEFILPEFCRILIDEEGRLSIKDVCLDLCDKYFEYDKRGQEFYVYIFEDGSKMFICEIFWTNDERMINQAIESYEEQHPNE